MHNIGSRASKRTEQNLIQNLSKMWTSMPMWPPRMIVELEEGSPHPLPDDNALPYACGKKNGVAERAEVAFYLLKTRLPRNDRSDAILIVGLFVTCDVCEYGQQQQGRTHPLRNPLQKGPPDLKTKMGTRKEEWGQRLR